MVNWQTFGHQTVKNILNKQLAAEKFPHAYLFVGPEGLGKKFLAEEFAKKILETENLHNHPDFQILDAEGEITMDMAAGLINALSFKPFVAKKKVTIINNAQNLNQASGNALLKTLEEPSLSSIIILIAGTRKLLPTIVSRCQLLSFNAFSPELLNQFAQIFSLKTEEKMIELSFGLPGRLKKLAEDKVFFEDEKAIISRYQKIQRADVGEKLSAISALAEAEPEQLRQNLLSWLWWQTGELKTQPKSFVKVQAIMDAIASLQKNYNKKLVLQGLLLKI